MNDERKLIALFLVELGAKVELSTPLESLKMDSLDFVDLVLKCENAFDVKIPQEALIRINTVGDILTIIGECRVPVSG